MSPDSRLPWDDLLFSHYRASKHLLGGSLEAFSESLLEQQQALYAPALQRPKLSTSPDVAVRFEANGKRLRRYEDDRSEHMLPAALVLPFVRAVLAQAPEAGVRLASALCRELGSLYVPLPDAAAGADVAKVARLAVEFGEAITALAPIIADGRIDADDRPFLAAAQQQLDDLIGAATALKHQLAEVDRESSGMPLRSVR